MKYRKYIKNTSKWTRYLILMLFESFGPYEHILETIIKTENQFSSPVSLIKVMLLLKNELSFATPRKLFGQNVWYFCNMVLIHARAEIEIWTQGWQDKQKQMETMLLRYQPLVKCNLRAVLKKYFWFYWNCRRTKV